MAAGEALAGGGVAAGGVAPAAEVGPGVDPGPALWSLVNMSIASVTVSRLAFVADGDGAMPTDVVFAARGSVSIWNRNSVTAK